MKTFIKRFFSKNIESTAKTISKALKNDGVLEFNITSDHIPHIYSSLKKIPSEANFAAIDGILPKQDENRSHNTDLIWGVIVETRKNPVLEYVINNFTKNTNISIQLFHGTDNLDYIMSTSIADLVAVNKVYLTKLNTNELNASKYNALFLTEIFWQSIIGRKKILFFQTDAISCSNSDYTIDDFVLYDYIGSKWLSHRPVGLIIDGGNGGLSLRDWAKSYDCLSRFPPSKWSGGEDGYFAFHIELIGGKVAKGNECAQFSTQEEFLFKSWGGHKISCLARREKAAFLDYCQEAKYMLEKLKE